MCFSSSLCVKPDKVGFISAALLCLQRLLWKPLYFCSSISATCCQTVELRFHSVCLLFVLRPNFSYNVLSKSLNTSDNKVASVQLVHYPPETSSIMIMARMVATIKQAQNKGRWQRLFSHFCSRTANEEEEIVHKLLGEKFQGQLALLRDLFTTALYEDDGFRSLFSLVGTNGQGIGTSSLSQWVHACDALELPSQQREQLDAFIDQLYKDIDTETGDFLNCEGSGLFLLQSLSSCNHSCVPNAEASFPDNNFLLHLGALSDISPGEVRRNSDLCLNHFVPLIFRENYLFVCSCQKCMSQMDDADMTSEDEEEAEGETEDEMTDV
uniref:SET and MYND domain-containing protein 5-like n=1 Tax=Sinocyclocheilus anshuiensis TaxID=1608454 RepID=A0A671RAL4_9TELE